jgi:hypothetical protein
MASNTTAHRDFVPYPTNRVVGTVADAERAKAVHDEVLRVATERKADLIVLGATRHAGLRRRFLGWTALRVSRSSRLPVLVLPATLGKRELSPLDEAVLGWAA